MNGQAAEVEKAESLEEWYLVPEAVLGFYEDNLECLMAAAQAAKASGRRRERVCWMGEPA